MKKVDWLKINVFVVNHLKRCQLSISFPNCLISLDKQDHLSIKMLVLYVKVIAII